MAGLLALSTKRYSHWAHVRTAEHWQDLQTFCSHNGWMHVLTWGVQPGDAQGSAASGGSWVARALSGVCTNQSFHITSLS
jgi:hypothetical protein